MTLDQRLSSAATSLQERLDPVPASLERRREHTRRRRVGAALTVVLMAVGVAGALWLTRGAGTSPSISIAPRDSDVPPSLGSTTSTSLNPTVTKPRPPSTPPAEWSVVDYHGFRLFLPPTWRVVENECPGRDRTIALGDSPPNASCISPAADATWLWLRPIGPELTVEARSCGPGLAGALPGCQYVDPTRRIETWFFDGLDVALVGHPADSDIENYSKIQDSWQYIDQKRPEAADSYHLEQPLLIARSFVAAYISGNCGVVSSLADSTYTGGCPDAIPGAQVISASSTGVGGSVPTTGARILVNAGRAYDVQLQHEWSFTDRRGHWKVATVTEVDPNSPP